MKRPKRGAKQLASYRVEHVIMVRHHHQGKAERDERIRALLAAGLTMQETAREIGLTKRRVYQIAERDGVPRRQYQRKEAKRLRAERAQEITEQKRKYWEKAS